MDQHRWPSFDSYEIALLNAPRTLRHERLQLAQVETVPGRRKVVRRSGGAGAVYRMQGPADDVWALKLFHRSLDHSAERFEVISNFLHVHGHEPYFVPFSYDLEGLYVEKRWWPVLVMQWCPGLALDAHIEQQVNDSGAIDSQAMAREWIMLRAALRRLGVVHGDLQHGNILVDDNLHFRLVDYDGVVVPELAVEGMLATERGHPDYQHPQRLTMSDEPDLALFRAFEDFSSLVVLTSLMTVDPQLWERHGGPGGLLLGKQDLDDLEGSPAVEAITGSPVGAALIEKLRQALTDVDRSGPLLVDAAGELGIEMPPWNGARRSRSTAQAAPGGARRRPVAPEPGAGPAPALAADPAAPDAAEARSARQPLSVAEIERLVDGLARGGSDSAIANVLSITPGRVRAEVLRLQRELGVPVRRELAPAYQRRTAEQPTGGPPPEPANVDATAASTAVPTDEVVDGASPSNAGSRVRRKTQPKRPAKELPAATTDPVPVEATPVKAARVRKAAPKKADPADKATPPKRADPVRKAAPKKADPVRKAAAKKANPANRGAPARKVEEDRPPKQAAQQQQPGTVSPTPTPPTPAPSTNGPRFPTESVPVPSAARTAFPTPAPGGLRRANDAPGSPDTTSRIGVADVIKILVVAAVIAALVAALL